MLLINLTFGFLSGSVKSNTEAKQVMFADGIRPGGDLTETDGVSSMRLAPGHTGRRTKRVERTGESPLCPFAHFSLFHLSFP